MLSQEEVDNDGGGNSACDTVDVYSNGVIGEVIPGMKWVSNCFSFVGRLTSDRYVAYSALATVSDANKTAESDGIY